MANCSLKIAADVTVAAAGTAVKLMTTAPKVLSLMLEAPSGNTGDVFVGDSTVLASSVIGIRIPKGTRFELRAPQGAGGGCLLIDVNSIYVDAANNGDKLKVTYLEAT